MLIQQLDECPGVSSHTPGHSDFPRVILGYLTLLLAEALCLGLLCVMCRAAWSERTGMHTFVAFFAFGIPMVGFEYATACLWVQGKEQDHELWLKLGWTCVFNGLLWAVGLVGLIAKWAKLTNYDSACFGFWEGLCLFVGFTAVTLFWVGPGIAALANADR
jgi:hypothetical protein